MTDDEIAAYHEASAAYWATKAWAKKLARLTEDLIEHNLGILNRLEHNLGCAKCHGPLTDSRCPECQPEEA